MSIRALDWAFTLPIKGAMKSTLLALANHADDTDTCFPSLPRIALFAGTTDRGARLALRALEDAGLVRTVHAIGSRSNYELAVGTMTPEPRSSPKPRAPRNVVPPTPELGSSPPRNYVPQPRNYVPPNLQEPSNQPSMNHRGSSSGQLFADAAAPIVAASGPKRATQKSIPLDDIEAEFARWWQATPKKVDKADAAKLYHQARTKKRVPAAVLLSAMTTYAQQFAPLGAEDPKFSAGPAKWLRGEKWTDEPPPSNQPSAYSNRITPSNPNGRVVLPPTGSL